MASQFDLAPRLAALQAGRTEGIERVPWHARYMAYERALDDVDVACINIKGVRLDDTIVMVKLGKLEELVAMAKSGTADHLMETDTPHAVYSQE